VNPKIGVTFASAMRAFLRADPDVIMIGEVRDEETARIAIEASLTGHLVLSTLHTNSAAESIVRLLDLGMDPMNFADSLVGIIAQRLVRALCSRCKAPRPLAAEELERLAHDYVDGTVLSEAVGRQRLLAAGPAQGEGGVRLYQAVGCQACGGKGYKGRMGIYEVVENSPELKRMIETRASTNLVFDQAIASGTRSLKQDALEKVFLGVIDLRQAHTLFTPPSSVNPD
jgi:type II secretory ATPase GspE/PulE/Tfp pilus assembly ATPase PilB-like protein